MRLHLIRHGETTSKAEGRVQGHLDEPLNDRGLREATLLAERLAGMPIAALYASTLQRALRTAQIVSQRLQIDIQQHDFLMERDVGALSGLTREEIVKRWPEWRKQRLVPNAERVVPGYENDDAFYERVIPNILALIADHPHQEIAVVTHIFLDDGGVLNDNERRGAEWRRLIGEYLSPRLGGEPLAWGEANAIVFNQQWERFQTWSGLHSLDDEFVDFFSSGEESSRWLREMCEHVGVSTPDDCYEISTATSRYVRKRVRAGYEDAAPGVRTLFEAGYTLATASGETSEMLDRYLVALGIRDCFAGRLYGRDLVRAHKAGPVYYERILADSGLSPASTLVVDDNANSIAWAAQAGMQTVHMCRQGEPAPAAGHVVGGMLKLVDLLKKR